MKILVIGGSGVIGFKLVEYFNENQKNVEYTYHGNKLKFLGGHYLDITDKTSTMELFTKINPDIVIHTAALTNVDLCETKKELADLINITGTKNIIEGCKMINSKIIFISTSFVFDGVKQEYFEDDQTSPATYYGLTKFEGEKCVIKSKLVYLILRTDQPYCWIQNWQHTNSILRVINTLESNNILKEIKNWYNSPTYVNDIVHVIEKLIEKKSTGIFHVVGSDFMSRYDMALKVANMFNLDKNMITPINSDELNLDAIRVNVNLNNDKVFKETGIKMNNLTNGLIKLLEEKRPSK
jgi:dTDP-4-dehydrorhamnose reductase